MSSIRLPESVGLLTKTSSSTVALAASRINIGGQQYVNVNPLTLSVATIGAGGVDAALAANSLYYVYAVLSSGAMALIASTNASAPSGFSVRRLVGNFTTDVSSNILRALYSGQLATEAVFAGQGGLVPGNASGSATGAGFIGNLQGTQRAGTGGSSYSTRTTTAYPATLGSLVSLPLNKGVYLLSYSGGGYASSGSSSTEFYVYVGGVPVTNLTRGSATTVGVTGMTITIPIIITTDATTVAVYGLVNGALSITAPTHELWAAQIG